MRAVIIRHGKVDFQWRKWSTAEQFNEDCKMYDEAPIFPLASGSSQIGYQDIYVSSLQRSRETARQLFCEENFISTKLIDEVPLSASIISDNIISDNSAQDGTLLSYIGRKLKLPLIFWNISGRLQWFFHIRSQKECRAETVDRAKQFVEMIAEREKDCIIVTHGFFMHTLIKQMKKHAFRISHTRLNYSNGECVIAER